MMPEGHQSQSKLRLLGDGMGTILLLLYGFGWNIYRSCFSLETEVPESVAWGKGRIQV